MRQLSDLALAAALRPARRPSWQSILAAERASRAIVRLANVMAEREATKVAVHGCATVRPARARR